MPALQIRRDGQATLVPLRKEVTVLGRDASNDVVVDDKKASRNHCRIERAGRGWRLTDLSSRNGTMVNGEPVTAQLLQHGDRIEIGEAVYVFLDALDGDPSGATPDTTRAEAERIAPATAGEGPDAHEDPPRNSADEQVSPPESGGTDEQWAPDDSASPGEQAAIQGVRFSCPACGARMHYNAAFAGRVVTCDCGSKVRIPPSPEVILDGIPEQEAQPREPEAHARYQEGEDGSNPPVPSSVGGKALYWSWAILKPVLGFLEKVIPTPEFAKLLAVSLLLGVIFISYKASCASVSHLEHPGASSDSPEPEWQRAAGIAKAFVEKRLGDDLIEMAPIRESDVVRDSENRYHWNVSMAVLHKLGGGRTARSVFLVSITQLLDEGKWRLDSEPIVISK